MLQAFCCRRIPFSSVSSTGRGAAQRVRASGGSAAPPPWKFGFQCNERYLDWDASAQKQLLRLHCAQKLGWSMDEIDEALSELSVLLPDLPGRLERMKAALLLNLLSNRAAVAETLLVLKTELPTADASAMVSRYPALLTDYTPDSIRAKVRRLRERLPTLQQNIDSMVEREPRMLDADVDELLANIRRILPGRDPLQYLASATSEVVDMVTAGLRPSIEDEYSV